MDAKISDYLVGIVMFTFIIVGGVSLVSVMRDGGGDFGDEEYDQFNATFNKQADVESKIAVMASQAQANSTSSSYGSFGVLGSLISGAWHSLKLTFSSWGFMTSVFGGLSSVFGENIIPKWAIGLVLALVSLLILFTIFSAIFQRDT